MSDFPSWDAFLDPSAAYEDFFQPENTTSYGLGNFGSDILSGLGSGLTKGLLGTPQGLIGAVGSSFMGPTNQGYGYSRSSGPATPYVDQTRKMLNDLMANAMGSFTITPLI